MTAFTHTPGLRPLTGLLLGPLLFLILLLLPTPTGMPEHGLQVAAVAVLMATLWITEAVPIPVTALLPIILFPLLGILNIKEATSYYAHPLVFLFMGGFLIALAIEKWHLHKRIALMTILFVGVSSKRIILGFMLATAFLSAWISNTATAMMMVTIGMAVARQAQPVDQQQTAFSTALMLGIAYAASIGGVATLIGTPPNAILAGVIESSYNIEIGFLQWMTYAAPLSILFLFICWYYLTHIAFTPEFDELPGGRKVIEDQLKQLGPTSLAEKKVMMVFCLVALGWIIRGLLDVPLLNALGDEGIAISGAILLFIIPANFTQWQFLLDWDATRKLPWDIIILFGGGFALAGGFASSGLTEWLAQQLGGLQTMPTLLIIFMVVLLVIFLTEVTSNTATSSLMLPVMGAFALAIQLDPMYLMVATAMAASFAFMLPVATPPNAIAFSSRLFSIPQMARAGLWLNITGSILITGFVMYYLPLIFDLK